MTEETDEQPKQRYFVRGYTEKDYGRCKAFNGIEAIDEEDAANKLKIKHPEVKFKQFKVRLASNIDQSNGDVMELEDITVTTFNIDDDE